MYAQKFTNLISQDILSVKLHQHCLINFRTAYNWEKLRAG